MSGNAPCSASRTVAALSKLVKTNCVAMLHPSWMKYSIVYDGVCI